MAVELTARQTEPALPLSLVGAGLDGLNLLDPEKEELLQLQIVVMPRLKAAKREIIFRIHTSF